MTDATISEHAELWKGAAALIKPELRDFVTVVPSEVHHLVELAECAEDPTAWLADEFNKRGQRKKDLKDFYAAQRKKDDAAKIRNVAGWPMSHLPLKTQPWITNATGRMRFALIHSTDLLTVIEEGKAPVQFATIEEIVETWSVD